MQSTAVSDRSLPMVSYQVTTT